MKSFLVSLSLALAVPAFAQTNVPEIPFEAPVDYFKYPAEMNLGELSAVATNSKGHVFILSRSNTTGT